MPMTFSNVTTLQIWSLPKLSLVYSTASLPGAPNVCVDSFASVSPFTDEVCPLPEETIVEDIVVSPIGDAKDRHYITVNFSCTVI
jgi:cleavage and polyadenylation specificity factor subunit 1